MVPNIPSKIAFGITNLESDIKFKHTEVGKIPQEWRVVKTGDVCTSIVPGRNKPKVFNGDIPWITIPDVDGLMLSTSKTGLAVSREELRKAKGKTIPPNTVVMTCVGTFGIAAVTTREIVINQQLHGFVCKEDVLPLYLCWVLRSKEGEMITLAGKTTIPYLNREKCESIYFALPPLSEQKKIAAILSSVDEAIASTKAVIDQTRKVKQGLLQQLLTCGIGHTKFKNTAIGKTPEGWAVLPLANLCYKITDGSHQAVKTSKDGQIPFLYVSCVRDGKILWENTARISFETYNDISKGREPKPGVVLYTAVGSYGHAALVHTNIPFSFQRHIAYILPNPDKIYSEFISIFLNSSIGRKYADTVAVGNAQKTVTLQQLSSFTLPVPPLAEQKKIIEIISTFENILSISENRLQMLSEIKHGLMQDLLTGRVRVNT